MEDHHTCVPNGHGKYRRRTRLLIKWFLIKKDLYKDTCQWGIMGEFVGNFMVMLGSLHRAHEKENNTA